MSPELEHLMKSLDDLDEERSEGRIDEETYAALHADYTARAAALLRAERDGVVVARPAPAPVPRGRRVLIWSLVVVFVIGTCSLVVLSFTPREPGGTLTGTAGTTTTLPADEFERHMLRARELNAQGKAFEALKEYDEASTLRPDRSEGLTESGWMLRLAARSLDSADPSRAQLLDAAESRLRAALKVNDGFPDKFVFSGIFLCRDRGASEAAVPLLQEYLRLQPDSPMGAQVSTVLADAQAGRCQAATP